MKIGFLYAGQGSQFPGKGKDLYENYPVFRDVYDNASLDFDLKKISFENNEEINKTRYTQPCMVAFAIGVTKILKERGITPSVVAGLSLGEYSALYASSVLSEKDALDLVAFRGKAMEEAAEGIDSMMSAVLGLDRETIESTLKYYEDVFVANYNSPGQIVIGGEKSSVERASLELKEKGAKRCMPLNVSGPFHTPYMKKAGDKLSEYFKNISFSTPSIPVVFNAIGREKNEDEIIPELLVKQVQSSVYMEDSIRYMNSMGVDTFIEIGPGKALSGFVKKTLSAAVSYSITTSDDLEALITKIRG